MSPNKFQAFWKPWAHPPRTWNMRKRAWQTQIAPAPSGHEQLAHCSGECQEGKHSSGPLDCPPAHLNKVGIRSLHCVCAPEGGQQPWFSVVWCALCANIKDSAIDVNGRVGCAVQREQKGLESSLTCWGGMAFYKGRPVCWGFRKGEKSKIITWD